MCVQAGRQPHRPWRFGRLEKEKEETRHFASRHREQPEISGSVSGSGSGFDFLSSGQAKAFLRRPTMPPVLLPLPLREGGGEGQRRWYSAHALLHGQSAKDALKIKLSGHL